MDAGIAGIASLDLGVSNGIDIGVGIYIVESSVFLFILLTHLPQRVRRINKRAYQDVRTLSLFELFCILVGNTVLVFVLFWILALEKIGSLCLLALCVVFFALRR